MFSVHVSTYINGWDVLVAKAYRRKEYCYFPQGKRDLEGFSKFLDSNGEVEEPEAEEDEEEMPEEGEEGDEGEAPASEEKPTEEPKKEEL